MRYSQPKSLTLIGKLLPVFMGFFIFGLAGYYSLEAYQFGKISAAKSRWLNEGQQLESAFKLSQAQVDNHRAELDYLVRNNFLDKSPPKWQDGDGKTYFIRDGLTAAECLAINDQDAFVPHKQVVLEVVEPNHEQTGKYGCLSQTRQLFFRVTGGRPSTAKDVTS